MPTYDSVFQDVLKEKIFAKGTVDLCAPGTINRGQKAALVNKSGNGAYRPVIVFDRVSCEIDVYGAVMEKGSVNGGTKASLNILDLKNPRIKHYELIGDNSFIQKILDEYNDRTGE